MRNLDARRPATGADRTGATDGPPARGQGITGQASPAAADVTCLPRPQRGFTLLEVLVALTLAGLALGALFGVIAGNKRLAWRSEEALIESTQVRALLNFSQLQDGRGDLTVDFVNRELLLSDGIELEMNEPERKSEPALYTLRGYEIVDDAGETVAQGSYWIKLDLPE